MPRNKLITNICEYISSHRVDLLIISIICIFHWYFSLTSNLYLINGFIYVDEFLYTSRAWEVEYFLSHGSLPYYPLFDHPPLGWILMGVFGTFFPGLEWTIRTRLFTVILYSLEVCALYSIISRLFSRKMAILNLIIFGFQPYFIYLKTMTILDNIGMFFIIFGILFMLKAIPQIPNMITSQDKVQNTKYNKNEHPIVNKYFFLSAISAGCAVITKFPMICFLPGFVLLYISIIRNYGVIFQKKEFKKHIHMWLIWLLIFWTPFTIYFICILKYDFLGDFMWNFNWQMTRDAAPNLILFTLNLWLQEAPVSLITVLFFPIIIFIVFILKILMDGYKVVRKRANQQQILSKIEDFKGKNDIWLKLFGISAFIVFYLVFLFRGGIILFHYFIPLITLSIILLSGLCYKIDNILTNNISNHHSLESSAEISKDHNVLKKIYILVKKLKKRQKFFFYVSWLSFCMLPLNYSWLFRTNSTGLYQALDYVEENLPRDSIIIVNEFFVAELRDMGFEYVQLIWYVVSKDYDNDWRNIDYFIASGLDMVRNSFTEEAVDHCVEIISFQIDSTTALRIRIYRVEP